jgi:hypothetical protein
MLDLDRNQASDTKTDGEPNQLQRVERGLIGRTEEKSGNGRWPSNTICIQSNFQLKCPMLGLMKTCQKLGCPFTTISVIGLVSATSDNRFRPCRRSFSLGLEYRGRFGSAAPPPLPNEPAVPPNLMEWTPPSPASMCQDGRC